MEEDTSPASEMTLGTYKAEDARVLAKEDMSFFGALSLPDVCTVLFPAIFTGMWKLVIAALLRKRDFSKFALGLPRGHGKTTVIKLLIVFIVLFTNKRFILIVGASATLAENILADVVDILDSPNIIRLFGNWSTSRTIDRADQKVFTFKGRKIVLKAIGTGGTLRGINVGNARPDVIICDDMQTKEEAESEATSKKLLQWFVGTLMKAKNPFGCTYLYVGNMYRDIKIGGSTSDIYTCILRNLQRNETWVSWIVGGILTDGTALWPEVQPIEQLLDELKNDTMMGQAEVFFSEVLNDPAAGSTDWFDIAKMPVMPFLDTVSTWRNGEKAVFMQMIDKNLDKHGDPSVERDFMIRESIMAAIGFQLSDEVQALTIARTLDISVG